MSEQHFRTVEGEHLGGFSGGAVPPDGAIECVAPPEGQHIFANGIWVARRVNIAEVRANAIAAMISRIDQFTAQFTSGVPKDEMASWPTKAAGAEVVLGGGDSEIISAEAEILGLDAIAVATNIAAKSAQYSAIIGAVTGVRRAASAEIAAADDQAEVESALDSAMATAVSIAASMGLEF